MAGISYGKMSMCAFFQDQMGYLSHAMSDKDVSTQRKLQTGNPWLIVLSWSFFGATSCYRFLKYLAKLYVSLHKLVAEVKGNVRIIS